MSLKKQFCRFYGLRARLAVSVFFSAVICICVFFILNAGLDRIGTNYLQSSDFEKKHIQRQCESLQSYINSNKITTDNLNLLKKWEKKQPVILLELYDKDTCIYSSIYEAPVSSLMLDEDTNKDHYLQVQLTDRPVTVLIYSDFTYQYSVISTALAVIISLVLFIVLFMHSSQKMIRYICRLNEEVQILEGGNLEYQVSEEGNDEITDLAKSMNRMRETLQLQMETEQQLHRSNRQLITEMSHDLRTPLTGIMLYLEILRSHRYSSEAQLQDYLEKIDVKAHHMKLLSDHLFEYAMQENLEKQTEPMTMETAFGHALYNMQEDLKARAYEVVSYVEWKNCFVQVNVEYVQRIFENIISNIEKYADKKAEIIIDSIYSDTYCGLSVMNSYSTDITVTESNGVGIESIKTMMKQMNGVCNVEQTDVTYEITLLFLKL